MVGCQESCSLEDQWGLMGRAKGHGSPAKRARTGRGLPGASPTEKGSRLGTGGIRAIWGQEHTRLLRLKGHQSPGEEGNLEPLRARTSSGLGTLIQAGLDLGSGTVHRAEPRKPEWT